MGPTGTIDTRPLSVVAGLITIAVAVAALGVPADRLRATFATSARLRAVETLGRHAECRVTPMDAVPVSDALIARASRLGPLLASWQTIGGCGAGASASGVGGVRWIGRGVRGGYVNVESQGNYVKVGYGYNYVATTTLSHDLTPEWTLGLGVAYLYKFMIDPYQLGYDLANKGPGDVSLMLIRRLGEANQWRAVLTGGVPVGSHNVAWRSPSNRLQQDRQLGFGKPTGSLALERTFDGLSGVSVVGGSASWRGGENEFQSYRAPSSSVYAYTGYLLGPFVPAVGLTLTGFAGNDRDAGEVQPMPRGLATPQVSLEWSNDWVALLLGATVNYNLYIDPIHTPGQARHGLGAWVVALGLAFSP